MVNCHIKKYLIIFFVFVQGAVAFSCASDDEVLEVVDLSVNKEVVDFKSEAGTQNITFQRMLRLGRLKRIKTGVRFLWQERS